MPSQSDSGDPPRDVCVEEERMKNIRAAARQLPAEPQPRGNIAQRFHVEMDDLDPLRRKPLPHPSASGEAADYRLEARSVKIRDQPEQRLLRAADVQFGDQVENLYHGFVGNCNSGRNAPQRKIAPMATRAAKTTGDVFHYNAHMSSIAEELLEKVRLTVRRHDMLPERGAALLAVSGGPDSLALLHLVKRLRDSDYPGLALHVAHLHHGMRGDAADADQEFVAHESARLDVPIVTRLTAVPELARLRGIGVEQAGRDARYEFLADAALNIGATRIALGHQADDQAETVLMRARRGAGPRGAVGIPYVRRAGDALIVRPLLDCTRSEIEAFLAESGLRGRLDSTNLSGDYLRNRMRARIAPALRLEWGESLQPQLCALASAAQRLRRQAEQLCGSYSGLGRVSEGTVAIDARAVARLSESLFPELLRGWLEEAGLWSRTFAQRDYARVAEMLTSEASNDSIDLPGGITAQRRGDALLVRACGEVAEDIPTAPLMVNGVTDFFGGRIEAHEVEGGTGLLARRASPLEEFIDLDCVRGRLEVRAPRPGDRMQPLGAPGSRKFQDILTDLRIPAWRRRRLPVVTAGGHPIWIAGVRIAHEVRLTERTARALHLRFIPA